MKQKTLEKWVRGDSVPRETSLHKLCGALGMTAADFYSPVDQFVSILCEKGDHGYTPDQLQKEIERFSRDDSGEELRPLNPFQETMRLFGKETLQKIYGSYAGLYYAYMYWQNSDPEKENQVLALALEIHDYHEASNFPPARRQLPEGTYRTVQFRARPELSWKKFPPAVTPYLNSDGAIPKNLPEAGTANAFCPASITRSMIPETSC